MDPLDEFRRFFVALDEYEASLNHYTQTKKCEHVYNKSLKAH